MLNYRRKINPEDAKIQAIYENHDYLDAYSMHIDLRVDADPKLAIGGMREEIGQLEFNFLLENGLAPYHTMLDIGCGTLRGGRLSIKYLNNGSFTGADISSKAIAFAEQFILDENLQGKAPSLLLNENKDLEFSAFQNQECDFILAQSVFNHLPLEYIQQCFRYIKNVMHKHTIFFFTFIEGEDYRQTALKDFCYPASIFENLANEYGYFLEDYSANYNHPRGHKMFKITIPSDN